jgi:hypothetical protein
VIPKLKIELMNKDVLDNLVSYIPEDQYPNTNKKLKEMTEIIESNAGLWG